jgi:hypothetical protein
MGSPFVAGYVAIGAAAGAAVLWLLLPTDVARKFFHEGGPVETVNAVMYAVVIVALIVNRHVVTDRVAWIALMIVAAAFGARELDLHIAWTEMSILKSRFYLGSAPAQQKIAGFLVAGTAIASILYLMVRYCVPTLRGLLRRNPVAVTVAVFFAVLFVSKMLDRSVSILTEDAGIAISAEVRVLVQALEEMLEMVLPAAMVLGLLQRRGERAR